MTLNLPLLSPQRFYVVNPVTGRPVTLGTVWFYTAGTSSPKAVYLDAAGTSPAPNPIDLDAAGGCEVYLSGIYRIEVKDQAGATVLTRDQVNSIPVELPEGNPGSLLIANNLSDVADKAVAREALGLRKQTSASDATADRVLMTGAFGVGGGAVRLSGANSAASPALASGLYYVLAGDIVGVGLPAGTGNCLLEVRKETDTLAQQTLYPLAGANLNPRTRVYTSGAWTAFTGGDDLSLSSISLGSHIATAATDVSEHLALWGETYGLSVTTGSLNIVSGGRMSFYCSEQLAAVLDPSALTIGTSGAGPAQNGAIYGTNSISLQVANGLAGTGSFMTMSFGATRQYMLRRDGIMEIGGTTGFLFNAQQDGTGQPGYLTCRNGSVGFVLQSGRTTGAIYQMLDAAGAVVGRIEPDDATVPFLQSILTRRKGGALYAPVSSSRRYKEGISAAGRVPGFLDLGMRRWARWGGDLAADDPRRGRPGYGLIKEEVASVLPEAVAGDDDGLDPLTLIGALHAEVKALREELDALKAGGGA